LIAFKGAEYADDQGSFLWFVPLGAFIGIAFFLIHFGLAALLSFSGAVGAWHEINIP
jgi:hypothetical protein